MAATLSDVIERLKAEGNLTRNSGTNSIKSLKEIFGVAVTQLEAQSKALENSEKLMSEQAKDAAREKKLAVKAEQQVSTSQGVMSSAGQGIGAAASGIGSGIGSVLGGFSGLLKGLGVAGLAALAGMALFPAQAVKDNINTLLSIGDQYENRMDFFLEGGALGLALFGLGKALMVFGIGGALVTGGKILDTLNQKLGGRPMAEGIKHDIETLLSINVDGIAGWTKAIAGLPIAFASLGAGLAVFGGGSGITKISEGIQTFNTAVGGRNFADGIKEDIETLMSINIDGWEGYTKAIVGLPVAMGAIALGLAAFGGGSGAAKLSESLDIFNTAVGGRNFANGIKEDITTLMSIFDVPEVTPERIAGFTGAMLGITAGLAAFTLGKAASTVVDGADKALAYFTDDATFAERIKNQVTTLLSITDLTTGKNITEFVASMGAIATGILALTASEAIGTLADAGQKLLGFFGVQSPFSKIMEIADKSEDLDRAAGSLKTIAAALGDFGNIRIGGDDLDFEGMAKNLARAMPFLMKLSSGGRYDPIGPGDYNFGPENGPGRGGLLDPNLNLERLTEMMSAARNVLSGLSTPQGTPANSALPIVAPMLNQVGVGANGQPIYQIVVSSTGGNGQQTNIYTQSMDGSQAGALIP